VSRREDGSVTVWALMVVLLTWSAAAVCAIEAVAVRVRHHAAAAADAASLAAAAAGGLDSPTACAAAGQTAKRLGAHVVGCRLDGPYATVVVRLAPPALLGWSGPVTARARAGPADTGKSPRYATTRAAT
jgi:secretion/DNA translocation related TadE-like protein